MYINNKLYEEKARESIVDELYKHWALYYPAPEAIQVEYDIDMLCVRRPTADNPVVRLETVEEKYVRSAEHPCCLIEIIQNQNLNSPGWIKVSIADWLMYSYDCDDYRACYWVSLPALRKKTFDDYIYRYKKANVLRSDCNPYNIAVPWTVIKKDIGYTRVVITKKGA